MTVAALLNGNLKLSKVLNFIYRKPLVYLMDTNVVFCGAYCILLLKFIPCARAEIYIVLGSKSHWVMRDQG